MSSFVTAEERYDFISDWAMDILISHEVEEVFLEDYSYGSTGKVFHIAENCGLLKYKMWQADIKVTLVAPTQIKKFATGKGNAKKELMYQSFFDETSRNLIEEFSQKSEKIGNPISDVVDSYFICKYSTSI